MSELRVEAVHGAEVLHYLPAIAVLRIASMMRYREAFEVWRATGFTANLGEPMASLPVTIFKFAMSPYENWQKLAWAGVFLITLGVLGLNILARVFFRNKH